MCLVVFKYYGASLRLFRSRYGGRRRVKLLHPKDTQRRQQNVGATHGLLWTWPSKSRTLMPTGAVRTSGRGKKHQLGRRLLGIQRALRPGDVLMVRHGGRSAKFRIVWASPSALAGAIKVAVQRIETEPSIWKESAGRKAKAPAKTQSTTPGSNARS
jgi:hypothetical protein